jgi:hypothetical protein
MSGPSIPVAGWYADPGDPASRLRYWDGATWTYHTSPRFEPVPPLLRPTWDFGGPLLSLGHVAASDDPLHRLAGQLRNVLVAGVVMQNGEPGRFGTGRDQ